jgi:hypothetical protein
MEIERMILDLQLELEKLDRVILSLERLARLNASSAAARPRGGAARHRSRVARHSTERKSTKEPNGPEIEAA